MQTRTAILFTALVSALIMFFLGYLFGDRLGLGSRPHADTDHDS